MSAAFGSDVNNKRPHPDTLQEIEGTERQQFLRNNANMKYTSGQELHSSNIKDIKLNIFIVQCGPCQGTWLFYMDKPCEKLFFFFKIL